ncbi:hypothetical protein BGX38DRAFT_1329888 [Terfezia claveryi]|nr:hypothetical protein BGX38DRAFT_1329888 [Terfezia claveryi]
MKKEWEREGEGDWYKHISQVERNLREKEGVIRVTDGPSVERAIAILNRSMAIQDGAVNRQLNEYKVVTRHGEQGDQGRGLRQEQEQEQTGTHGRLLPRVMCFFVGGSWVAELFTEARGCMRKVHQRREEARPDLIYKTLDRDPRTKTTLVDSHAGKWHDSQKGQGETVVTLSPLLGMSSSDKEAWMNGSDTEHGEYITEEEATQYTTITLGEEIV